MARTATITTFVFFTNAIDISITLYSSRVISRQRGRSRRSTYESCRIICRKWIES